MTVSLQRDIKRDADLIADYRSGNFTGAELTAKYLITPSRIYQILEFYKVKRKRIYGKKKRSKK